MSIITFSLYLRFIKKGAFRPLYITTNRPCCKNLELCYRVRAAVSRRSLGLQQAISAFFPAVDDIYSTGLIVFENEESKNAQV